MTNIDKIKVAGDHRVQRRTITINNKTYGYLIAEPPSGFSHTVFLIHGFPDLSMGWRYQIPFFVQNGLRVICPDCIGYGRSDSPTGPISSYSLKSQCQDFYELAKNLGCKNIILGGHDWGAMLAYRFALYFPGFITHLITFVVPYFPPSPEYGSPADLAKTMPSFGYQMQFGSKEGIIETHTKDKDGIKRFLNALYGGCTTDGEYAFSAVTGVNFALASQLSQTKLLDAEEIQYYVNEYARNGLQGPCNYYRTHHQNFTDELEFFTKQEPHGPKTEVPTLFIRATNDSVITSNMVDVMIGCFEQLTVVNVESSHWILWQRPKKVNEILKDWLQQRQLID